jgi:hypothetical protein
MAVNPVLARIGLGLPSASRCRRLAIELALAERLRQELITVNCEICWQFRAVRPVRMFAPVVAGAGLPVEVDGGDEEPGEAYLDELRVGDWAGQLGDLTVRCLPESMARRAKRLELT